MAHFKVSNPGNLRGEGELEGGREARVQVKSFSIKREVGDGIGTELEEEVEEGGMGGVRERDRSRVMRGVREGGGGRFRGQGKRGVRKGDRKKTIGCANTCERLT
jgi:hypothetical protein